MTKEFPESETFLLTNQMRRAASSITANIAEGCGRKSKKDFARFLYNAYGSIKECENFVLLSKDIGYINEDKYSKMMGELDSLSRRMNKFIEIIESDGDGPLLTAQGSRQV